MNHRLIAGIAALIGMLVLILDTKTALLAASDGVQLCLQTLIPSLFPFLVLSIYAAGSLDRTRNRGTYFFLGLLGGYPMGASTIAYGCKAGSLDKDQGSRMLCYCNNAGPAFLFGVGMLLFEDIWLCFLVWAVHILSAMAVASLTPMGYASPFHAPAGRPITLPEAVQRAVKTMGLICGWVVLFRVLLGVLSRWCLWMLPETGKSMIFGILELSNGILGLRDLQPLGLRVVLFGSYLGFGGLCVAMQTTSVLADSGVVRSMYLPAKTVQAMLSFCLLSACQWLLPVRQRWFPAVWLLPVTLMLCFLYRILWKYKKYCSILHSHGV